MTSAEPLVTVIIFAFNHEKYIADAIRSVLAQETGFGTEVLVAYTPSADNTAEAVSKAIEGHPRAQMITFDGRQKFSVNVLQLIGGIRGKYVIFTDGDDHWIFTGKLRESAQFLEENPDYAGIFHDAEIRSENTEDAAKSPQFRYYEKYKAFSQFNVYDTDYNAWDAVKRLVIPPGTLLFRSALCREAAGEFLHVSFSGMWMVHLFVLRRNKFRYRNECWSVYRNHISGLTKSNAHRSFIKDNIRVLRHMLKDPYYRSFRWDVYKSISREYELMLFSAETGRKRRHRLKIIWRMLYYYLLFFGSTLKRAMKNNW